MIQYQEVNNVKLAYSKYREGQKTLILLHGNGESGKIFLPLIKNLNFAGTIYAIDTRGHGNSCFAQPYSILQFADDLFEFIRLKKLTNVSILGYSDGANIAMAFASKYDFPLEKLVLISGNIYKNGLKISFLRFLCVSYYALLPFNFIKKIAHIRANFNLMLNDIGITFNDLNNIKCPTIVICAEKDLIKKEHTVLIAKNIQSSSLLELEDCTHFDILNKKEILNIF